MAKPTQVVIMIKARKKFVEVMKGERKLGERCQCKASYYTCKSISDSDRQKIFSDVWKMTWGEKQVFVKLSVEAKDVKERRGHGEQSRRNKTLYFTLRGTKGSHRVCKQMFLNTTGLNSWWVVKTATEEQESNSTTRSVFQLLQAATVCTVGVVPLQDAPLSNSSWKGYPKCRHITVEKTPPKCTWKLPSDRILMFTGNI